MNATTIVHWRIFERVMDLVWVGLMVYFIVEVCQMTPNSLGGGSTGYFTGIIAILFFLGCMAFLVLRPIRHEFVITPDTVTYTDYRCFGYVKRRSATFARNELGCLVFDTERRWCGLWGFTGVYATFGVPTRGAPVRIAFEIRIIYNGWVLNAMRPIMVGAHMNTFLALERALRLQRIVTDTRDHSTEVIQLSGNPMMGMVEQMNRNAMDSLASYETFVAANPAVYPAFFSVERSISSGKAVYFVESKVQATGGTM